MSVLIEIEGLAYRYPGAEGRPGVEVRLPALTLHCGDLIALTGPSGCGKSTLLDLVGLVLPPSAVARYRLHLPARAGGGDLAPALRRGDLDALARARAHAFGHVLQQGGLLPFFTVAENIALGAPGGDLRTLADELGIGELLGRKPAQLSIGQRQRVSIARALHARPPLLLADEPTAALDPPTAAEVMALLLRAAAERGMAILMANHDWGLIAAHGFRRLEAETAREADGRVTARFALAEEPA